MAVTVRELKAVLETLPRTAVVGVKNASSALTTTAWPLLNMLPLRSSGTEIPSPAGGTGATAEQKLLTKPFGTNSVGLWATTDAAGLSNVTVERVLNELSKWSEMTTVGIVMVALPMTLVAISNAAPVRTALGVETTAARVPASLDPFPVATADVTKATQVIIWIG